MQAPLALERGLAGFPGIRGVFVQQEGAILEVAIQEIVFDLLVRGDAVADNATQVGAIAGGLVHPRQVAHREIGVQAQATGATRAIAHPQRPQFHHVIHRQGHAPFHFDAVVLDAPRDGIRRGFEGETAGQHAHRLVRHGEQRAILFILEVAEASGVMRVVRLLRLHEAARFQRGGMRVLGGFRLHELRGGETAASGLHHHPPVPQEAGGMRHRHRTVDQETFAFVVETEIQCLHASCALLCAKVSCMPASAASSSG